MVIKNNIKSRQSSNKVKTDASWRKDYFLIVISIHIVKIIKKKNDIHWCTCRFEIKIKIVIKIMMIMMTKYTTKWQNPVFEMENCRAYITTDKNHIFKLLYKHHYAIYSGKHQNECI